MTETKSPLRDIVPADRIVLLKPVKMESVVKSGSIAVVSKDDKEIGEVVAVGGAGYNKEGIPLYYPVNMAPGDIIAYRKYGEGKFYFGTEQITFVGFDDVYAILKRAKAPKTLKT